MSLLLHGLRRRAPAFPPSCALNGAGRRSVGGFALLITITLLAFLVLLLVSLASLTRVETQVAANSQTSAQARQHALMALNIALGELQRHSGPDQRVTAAADVVIPSAVTINSSTGGAAARGQLDTYWNNARNRRWTGAWKNGNAVSYDDVRNTPALFNAVPELQSWLVSGNETALEFSPEDRVTGLTAASTPADEIADADGRPHRLLVKASAGVTDAATLHRAVTAPQVPILSPSVPGTDGSPATVGHYAWWIGDEGVKARANLIDAYAADNTDEGKLRRRTSAQRPALEAITTDGTDGLATLYTANHPRLQAILDGPQLSLLNTDPAWNEAFKARFHDLTTRSQGVLSDTRHGGLKRDLSYLLGQPDVTAFRAALNAAYDGGGAAPLTTYNPALSSVSTLHATLPDNVSSLFPFDGSRGILSYSATWEQLWSFHNMGNASTATPPGVYNSAGEAEPRLMSGEQHGLYPLLLQTKLFYRLRIVGGAADPDGVNRGGDIWVDIIPLAVLANPYSVALAPADYWLRISDVAPQVRFGTDPAPPAGNGLYITYPAPAGYTNLPNGYLGDAQLILRSTGIGPGEAQIFTIDPSPAANSTIASDRIEIPRTGATPIILHNDYDPQPALTFNTGLRIPADKTHAALLTTGNQIVLRLYLGTGSTSSERLIRYARCQNFMGSTPFFTVAPMQNGVQEGGGFITVLTPPSFDGLPSRPQQAPFYQINYRALVAEYHGAPDQNPHLAEWSRAYAKRGDIPNPARFIEAHIMRPGGGLRTTRWGLVTMGEGPDETNPPAVLVGTDTGFQNLLYDLPRRGQPLASLGQLQHFNTTGHIPVTNFAPAGYPGDDPTVVHSWQVNYPIANSYPHPRVFRERLFYYTGAMGYHYDGSYLWNTLLWDRFTLSTYPASGSFDFATGRLVNARYRPFRDRAAVPWDDETRFRGDGNPATAANSRLAAQNLLVEGAFNINSTSHEAWKAVFAGLRGVPVGGETASSRLTAPFARTLAQTGGATDSQAGVSPNAWNGIRNLTHDEINDLADEMVLQIRRRGPFLSLADFVNRRLVSATGADADLGLAGALQAAIDRVTNKNNDIPSPFNVTSLTPATSSLLREADYLMTTGLAGFPGYLLQGDILSVLGPTLAARSDTFLIRAYGDAVNPVTTTTEGRAWCEAIVQRLPDYVSPADEPHANATAPDNIAFGRRYRIIGFRWLSPADI